MMFKQLIPVFPIIIYSSVILAEPLPGLEPHNPVNWLPWGEDAILSGSLNIDKSTRMDNIIPVTIRFQACNDQICLALEKLTLRAAT